MHIQMIVLHKKIHISERTQLRGMKMFSGDQMTTLVRSRFIGCHIKLPQEG